VPGGSRRRSKTTARLARAMLKRARLTDDVGWLGEHHMAALLTDTNAQGAQAFADGVADMVARHGPRPAAMLYTYPHEQLVNLVSRETGPTTAPLAAAVAGYIGAARTTNAGETRIAQTALKLNFKSRAKSRGNDDGTSHSTQRAANSPPNRTPLPVAGVEELLAFPMPKWKRALDIIISLVAMVLLAPILLAAALAIKLTSRGPVIFAQRRSGLCGEPFVIYKFRTMIVNAEKQQQELRKLNEQDGPAFKLTRDPRVTRVGALLRKTSIDELPQLWNVLKGDMSLVGPRPLPISEQEGCEQWQRHRLNVTPGLTCIWQVKGRSTVSFSDWVRMDVEYMRRRTILHDLIILFSTIPAVLLRRGAR
jgi:lipopolysaccharide/colanic/teichoic acid biosynthesis glycosyltransferase